MKKMVNRKIPSVCLALLLLFSSAAFASNDGQGKATPLVSPGQVVSISDLHFNPFYDPTLVNALMQADYTKWQAIFARSSVLGYGTHKADTNYVLLNSALDNIYAQSPHPDFIIISGDFLEHDFQDDFTASSHKNDPKAAAVFIDKTIAFVTWMIEKRFPGTPVYPSLGNNDSDCGDYWLEPGGAFLKTTGATWKTLLNNKANVDSFMQTFPALGSYSVVAPFNKNHRVIALNTTFFSANYQNKCGDPNAQPGKAEMKWLEGELQKAEASKQKVWLLYHIPPGVDVYNNVQKHMPAATFWQADFNDQFLQLLERYAPVIVSSFAGHIHMDSFELVRASNSSPVSLVHITPAFSPLFYNNPGFEVLSYDRLSAGLNDYTVYYFNLASASAKTNAPVSWDKEYTFSEVYGLKTITVSSMAALYDALPPNVHKDPTKFEIYYNVNNAPGIPPAGWRSYWCGISYLTVADYQKCVSAATGK
jgi:sphingomyelin phosphodiesterase acid-like 3